MKMILLIATLCTSTCAFSSVEALDCYNPITAKKELTIEIQNDDIKNVIYSGLYNPTSGPAVMDKVKGHATYSLTKSTDYLKLRNFKLTENEFGIFVSAYQSVELSEHGTGFDADVIYVCK